ncbi:MAG TPA: 1-acyl-sn-glycerol-3-phosphate acyltransferase [Anaerolineales bacterium]|nr:1-acyl-sn-glycerol-3-phosphate acyltransferase [Anaerolineales bacterium]
MDTETEKLSRALVVEITGAVGLRNSKLAQRLFWPLFRPVTDRLARIGMTFDRDETRVGYSAAMENALQIFIRKVTARGKENIPASGPLLVLSNHPGTYDSLIISSELRRDDLCIISGNIPFLKSLPQAYKHFFFISLEDQNVRTVAARQAIRHLKAGGAVLLYGFGHIDPDPAVYDDAPSIIEKWSPSIELFLKVVPETRVLVTITSHVVSPNWRNSLLYHLRRDPVDRRRLVEFGQVMTQLLFPGTFRQSPQISFAPPVTAVELRRESGSERVLPAIIARGKALLEDHCRDIPECNG